MSVQKRSQIEDSRVAEGAPLSGPLAMDLKCLAYLVEMGGRAPFVAIPAKLFKGEVPAGQPDLIDLGLVVHDGADAVITDGGRAVLLADALKNFTDGRDISYVVALEYARNVLKVA